MPGTVPAFFYLEWGKSPIKLGSFIDRLITLTWALFLLSLSRAIDLDQRVFASKALEHVLNQAANHLTIRGIDTTCPNTPKNSMLRGSIARFLS
jgi:hypothetical protein